MKDLLTVSKFTFFEVYRSKLMVSLFFLVLGLIIASYVSSSFGYGAPAKIALDVGLGIMSLSNLVIAILIGSTLLSKEIEQRTLYMIISRPISRGSFIIGKILGLSSILVLNSFILGIVSIGLFLYFGGVFQALFFWTLYFSFLEALTVLLFAVLFSLITNNTLAIIYTVVIFIAGHAINETAKLWFAKVSPLFSSILDVSLFLIPNFYRLNLKDFLIYQQNISTSYLQLTQLYILIYLAALITAIILIFKNKNLD